MVPSTGPLVLELCDQEPESDDEAVHVSAEVIVDSPMAATEPHNAGSMEVAWSSHHASSSSSSSSSSSWSDGSDKRNASAERGILAAPTSLAKETPGGDDGTEGSQSSSESESYFVSQEDPAIVAVELGASGAKLIGGQIVGSLHFESSDREPRFLSEACKAFCFPLMEELMKTGVPNMLGYAQDLSLEAMVAARCAEHQL